MNTKKIITIKASMESQTSPPTDVFAQRLDEIATHLVQATMLPTVYPTTPDRLFKFATLLHQEGFPAIELLCRPLDQALAVMRALHTEIQTLPIKWGMGTITNLHAAGQAISANADFLVSPAFSRNVLKVAIEKGVPYLPAVQTFQDVQDVIESFGERNLTPRILKLCPVFSLDERYVAALVSCFPGITFCPTGEITLDNYFTWRRMTGIGAPMGSELVPRAWIEQQEWNRIQERLRYLKYAARASYASASTAP